MDASKKKESTMKTPRYLRFIQALVLAAAVPACGVDVDAASASSVANPQASSPPSAITHEPEALATQDAGAVPDAGAAGPHTSGPIVPPQQTSAV
jgi:hypothetical protein